MPILLDESLSFGVLGDSGHGATEYWGVSVCGLLRVQSHGAGPVVYTKLIVTVCICTLDE